MKTAAPDRLASDAIVAAVLDRATADPDAVALIDGSDALSYRQLSSCVRAVAVELRERRIRTGDRVLVEASSTPGFVVCYLAVHLTRGVAVPIDMVMPKSRREFISNRVAAAFVLSGQTQQDMLVRARNAHADPTAIDKVALEPPAGDSIADIIFTSGTTGNPKGVILSHRNLAAAAGHINAFVGSGRGDVEVLPLPLGHSFGLGSLRCLLSVGATVVLVGGFSFPGEIYSALEQHRASGFRCVPAGLTMMLRFAPDRLADCASHIRYVELGSAPMPLEDKRKLMELLPHSRICMHYGLTEATRSVYIEFHADAEKLHSIGRPAEGVQVRIADSEGQAVARGEPGAIQIRGPHVTPGYWQEAELTRQALAGDWLRTGDVGHFDDQGYLYLHGRNDDMINVGGRKVSPLEVEEALRMHPCVLDCGCSGIADPAGVSGEAVGVLVLLREGEGPTVRELRDHLRARLEPYKLPVKWVFSGGIPRTANGKIQRHVLRQQLEAAVA